MISQVVHLTFSDRAQDTAYWLIMCCFAAWVGFIWGRTR